MVLSDFLSRQDPGDEDMKEIIPISFNMKTVLQDKCYNNNDKNVDRCMVQTRSQTKASGVELPEVHGSSKRLDPYRIMEKQTQPIDRVEIDKKPRIGQGRAGMRRRAPPLLDIRQETSVSKPIVISNEVESKRSKLMDDFPRKEILPPYLLPQIRLPPKPPDNTLKKQEVESSKVKIAENSQFQESIISEIYERPDKSYFQEPIELKDLINTNNIVQQFLPKQADIDIEIIKRKVLKGMHLPLTLKEIQSGYLSSLYFKDIYIYLAHNRLPSKKIVMRRIEMLAEKYILLDLLLFQLRTIPGKEMALLAIPEVCTDKIITLYHSNLFAGHQGVIKTYLTISDRFYIPNLMHYLRSYIKGCHICQLNKKEKLPERQLQSRINLNYRPLSRLSMDLKVMPKSYRGDRYILCVIDEVTNYIITAPVKQAKSEEVGEILINSVFSKYCVPYCIIMDLDSAFMSSLMAYLFKKLGIQIKTVALYNHQSLQAEHGIKSLSNILMKHLTKSGDMWIDYLPFATLAHNTYNSPNLGNYSPYELVFGRKPKLLLELETDPNIKVAVTYKEYYERLEQRLKYLQKVLLEFKTKHLALLNKDREYFQYNSGDLVYLISPLTSQLRTASRKIMVKYVGPLVVYKIVDPHNYLLMTLDGKLLRGLFEHERIKPAIIRMSEGNVSNLASLRQVMSAGILV